MMLRRKYIATIESFEFLIPLDEMEISTFITHFGKFGDISIFDVKEEMVVLKTKGIYMECFYPDICDRKLAEIKARHLYDALKDYNYQRKRKYPKGRFKPLFKIIDKLQEENNGRKS